MQLNSLDISKIRCDELISKLITSRHFRHFRPKIFPFWQVMVISVTSFKFNSSHYNLLIISVLSLDVTSDEFLTKTFIVFVLYIHS